MDPIKSQFSMQPNAEFLQDGSAELGPGISPFSGTNSFVGPINTLPFGQEPLTHGTHDNSSSLQLSTNFGRYDFTGGFSQEPFSRRQHSLFNNALTPTILPSNIGSFAYTNDHVFQYPVETGRVNHQLTGNGTGGTTNNIGSFNFTDSYAIQYPAGVGRANYQLAENGIEDFTNSIASLNSTANYQLAGDDTRGTTNNVPQPTLIGPSIHPISQDVTVLTPKTRTRKEKEKGKESNNSTSGPSPYPRTRCSKCPSTFSRKADLLRHMRDKHSGRVYDCWALGCQRNGEKAFGRRDKLLDHQRKVHGMKDKATPISSGVESEE
ncbi:MAG: hypothetical protein M1834_008305 [Cirrosporium novae-zelandiae]|nr:MAG: hypothetical protein M1834_008305 [Cirrosporium novae-zelandiae]